MPKQDSVLDPRQFVMIKPVPVSDSRSGAVFGGRCPRREQDFWDNYNRRQTQLSQQGYRAAACRPYEEVGGPVHLEPKKLVLESLGQWEEPSKSDGREDDEGLSALSAQDCSQKNKEVLQIHRKLARSADTDTLRKHLLQSRKLLMAVKRGCSYFHLIKELESQEKREEEQRRQEERKRSRIPPPSHTDTHGQLERSSAGGGGCLWKKDSSKRVQCAPSFTPLHHTLTSQQPHQLTLERIYCQLCCLNWLLESLTMEGSGRLGPLTCCWDVKDPGRGRMAVRVANKEKFAVLGQFVSQLKNPVLRSSHLSSGQPLTRSKCSASCSSLSSLMSTTPGSSDAGDVALPRQDIHTPSTNMVDVDPPVTPYLQKLLDEVRQSVFKELYGSGIECMSKTQSGAAVRSFSQQRQSAITAEKMQSQRPKSSPARKTAPVSAPVASASPLLLSQRAADMLENVKLEFDERVEEAAFSLNDALEHIVKRRWSSGIHVYTALSSVSSSSSLISFMSSLNSEPKVQEETDNRDATDDPDSPQWLSALLDKLPTPSPESSKLACVMERLRGFTRERTMRIRPQVFLRLLNSLEPWELCYPDLCVAIQIVRENAVKMSAEEYNIWLHGKLAQRGNPD